MTDLTLRVPPHNDAAEVAVLGSVLLHDAVLADPALSRLTPEDFYREGHRIIWACIPALRAQIGADGKPGPVDLVTLQGELARRGKLDEVGGVSYLIGLSDQTPTSVYAGHYARIVLEQAHLRGLMSHCGRVIQACHEQELPLEDIDLMAARPPRLDLGENTIVRIGTTLRHLLDQANSGTGPQGAPTGLTDLDALIGGLEPGRLYVEAARPGFGKTALAFQIGVNVARERGRVLSFSLEMPAEEIGARLVCSEAKVGLGRFTAARRGEKGALSSHDWDNLTAAQARLDGLPLDILAKPGLRLQELLDEVRREHAREPLSLFILDYVQLVQVSGRAGENTVQRVTLISGALKALAMELQIPVLALAQLSRAPEQRPNHRPLLSDLRESGSLEQDADVVLFIYREEKYDPKTDQKGIAEIIVGKQRNGPTDTVKVQFHGAFVRFSDLTLQYPEAV